MSCSDDTIRGRFVLFIARGASANRGVLLKPANWASVPAYYATTPANFYSQFWHKRSAGGWPTASPMTTTITRALPLPRNSRNIWHSASAGSAAWGVARGICVRYARASCAFVLEPNFCFERSALSTRIRDDMGTLQTSCKKVLAMTNRRSRC